MKKVLALAMAGILTLATGCQNNANESGDSNASGTATTFPQETINLTVAFNAGGGTDLTARAFAEVAPPFFNDQNFTVSNVSGGGGATWYAQGAKQKPTGAQTTVVTVEVVTLPLLQKVPFTYEDYTYIARMNFPAAAITVPTDSPYQTLDDFIEAAKANPGQIKVGNSGVNAIWDLHTYALGQATGVTFNHIPYEGAAPAVKSLMSGELDAVAVSAAEVSSQVLDGSFRMLAVASDERLAEFPDTPTYQELNIDVPNIGGWRGLALPKETPDDVVAAYRAAAKETINSPEFKELMAKQNLTVDFLSGEDFTTYVQEQNAFFGKLIQDLNLVS